MRTFPLASVLLLLANVISAATMADLDQIHVGYGNVRYGAGQIAVQTVRYAPPSSQIAEQIVCAVSMGNDKVRLYTFDRSTGSLSFSEELVFAGLDSDEHIFDLSFIRMVTTGIQPRWCLVAPVSSTSQNKGGIDVFDLENRVYYHDCLDWSQFQRQSEVTSVFRHVSQYQTTDVFSINAGGDIFIADLTATFKGPKFTPSMRIPVGSLGTRNYAASSYSNIPSRAYETYPLIYGSNFPAQTLVPTCIS